MTMLKLTVYGRSPLSSLATMAITGAVCWPLVPPHV